jgi:mono/diheme cytochrome c family protein
MKRWMQWTAGTAVLLGTFVAPTAAAGWYLAGQKRQRMLEPKTVRVEYTLNTATLERGRYLFASRGCVDCHGAKSQGREFVNDGRDTRLAGPNITASGVVARYQPEDWDSVIRHGVKPDGRPVLFMPSEDYNCLSNDDLSALVSYVRQFPPRRARRP